MELTDRERQALSFIVDCHINKGWPPTVRELADHLGVSSPATVHGLLKRLESKGHITRGPGARAIRILHA